MKVDKKLLLITGVYFLTRIFFFWKIPLFEDEALFTGWALQAQSNISVLMEPLKTGIGPLFSWLTFLLLPFFPNQFLAGRIISVLAGLGTVLLVWEISKAINKKLSIIFTLIFVFFPIMVIYNCLALLDSLMVFLIILSFWLSWKYLEKKKQIYLFLTIVALLFSFLTKQIGLISVPAIILPSVLIGKNNNKFKLKLVIGVMSAFLLYLLIIFPFKEGNGEILRRHSLITDDIYTINAKVKNNFFLTLHWIYAYYPLSVILTAILGLIFAWLKGKWQIKYLSVFFSVYFLSIITTANLYFPRHTLIFAPFILIFSAYFTTKIIQKSQVLGIVLLSVILTQVFFSSVSINVKPVNNFHIATEDNFQFWQDWTSGKIISEVADYFNIMKNSDLVVWTDSSLVYYYGLPWKLNKNIEIRQIPEDLNNTGELATQGKINYLIVNKSPYYKIDQKEKKEFVLSPRHILEIYKLN